MFDSETIVFYCESKVAPLWSYAAPANCRGSFNPAVLGLLFYIDKNAELKPSAIDKYSWDFKHQHYKLILKDNLYFQNGRKVTAKDFEFSILRFFFTKEANIASTFMSNLLGTEKIQRGQPYQSGAIEGIKILDDKTIILKPAKYNPNFLYTFALADYALVPQEELQQDLLTWKTWPIGSGPYKVKSFDEKTGIYHLKLDKEKEYPNAPKKILFESNYIYEPDLTLKDKEAAVSKKYKKETMLASFYIRLLNFNFSSNLGKDLDFRKAVSFALSQSKISRATIPKTQPLYETIPIGGIGRINVGELHNIDEAKKLFKKVLGENYDNTIFKIPYTPDIYLGEEYLNIIKKQLSLAGFKVEFVKTTNLWNPFNNEFKDSPMYLCSQGADFIDPLVSFSKYRKGGPAADRYPSDPELGALIEETKDSNNRNLLNERLKLISNYFHEYKIVIPLFNVPTTVYYKANKIKNVGDQFGGATFYLFHVELNKMQKLN